MRQRDVLEGVPVFVTVAEAGSFSAAARRLGISPSAVSQAVGGLEERLGATLFRRSTRSLSLTDVGEEYLRGAAPPSPCSGRPPTTRWVVAAGRRVRSA